MIMAELEQRPPFPPEADTIEDPHTLITVEKMLQKVREDGISRCRSALLSDYTAISAPVFDYTGMIQGALTMMGRINSFDDSIDGEPARQLKRTCAAISATCGYVPKSAEPDTVPIRKRRAKAG
jgi:DNA-binding IclR family transcriptional regulator